MADRWAQIEELFHRAREREAGERIALLEEAGSTDPELRREVEELLSSQQAGRTTAARAPPRGAKTD